MSKIKDNFMTVKEFSLKHGVVRNHLCVIKDKIPSGVVVKGDVYHLVNESYFVRRDDFSRLVRNESQENFYELTEYLSGSAVARLIMALGGKRRFQDYVQFFSDYLFKNKDTSVLSNDVPDGLWDFWKHSRWLVKIVREIGFTDERIITQYILDRRSDAKT